MYVVRYPLVSRHGDCFNQRRINDLPRCEFKNYERIKKNAAFDFPHGNPVDSMLVAIFYWTKVLGRMGLLTLVVLVQCRPSVARRDARGEARRAARRASRHLLWLQSLEARAVLTCKNTITSQEQLFISNLNLNQNS